MQFLKKAVTADSAVVEPVTAMYCALLEERVERKTTLAYKVCVCHVCRGQVWGVWNMQTQWNRMVLPSH